LISKDNTIRNGQPFSQLRIRLVAQPRRYGAWVRQTETDQGKRSGMSSSDRERLKELERENRELKQANEILRKASAYFAQAELDRRPK
jgi:transposase-like protein